MAVIKNQADAGDTWKCRALQIPGGQLFLMKQMGRRWSRRCTASIILWTKDKVVAIFYDCFNCENIFFFFKNVCKLILNVHVLWGHQPAPFRCYLAISDKCIKKDIFIIPTYSLKKKKKIAQDLVTKNVFVFVHRLCYIHYPLLRSFFSPFIVAPKYVLMYSMRVPTHSENWVTLQLCAGLLLYSRGH